MIKKKKLLVVGQHYWPESFRITDICEGLVDLKDDVDLLCGNPNYPVGGIFPDYRWGKNRKQMHNGVNIMRCFETPRGNNSRHRVFFNYLSFALSSIAHIPKLLFKKYDRILCYQTSPVTMSIAGIILGKIKHIEVTIFVLDLWPDNFFSMITTKNRLFRGFLTIMSNWHYRQADKLIVLSEKAKNKLLGVTKLSPEKIIVLPQACEKIYEQQVSDTALNNRFNKGFNIVFTGNISPAQSFDTIVDAAIMLKKGGIDDINWIIVGDGMSRVDLADQFKKAGLSNRVFFEGQKPMDDIPKYFHIADILIGCLVKSDFLDATIPAKVMSYVAGGKPIVLAMDGEVQDLINNQIKCGYVGPTEDSETLSKNIRKIYEMSQRQRDLLGKNAKNYHFKHLERGLILKKLRSFIFK